MGFSSIKEFLEQINQTTDDFLFLYDIKNDRNQFFAAVDEVFAIGKPGSTTNTFAEMLAIVHPADRKTVMQDIEELRMGKKKDR